MKKNVLIFGAGPLQTSIISVAKSKGIYTIAIDPNKNAIGKNIADVFIAVNGDDFKTTCEVTEKYSIDGIVTAATDKPLLMMAKIAEKYNFTFPSYSAILKCTNKYLMKKTFLKNNIPCAKGLLVNNKNQIKKTLNNFKFPIIIKPLDSSGSRGVIFCNSIDNLIKAYEETKKVTSLDDVLIEEFIDGKEYSIEGIHYNGESHIIQITEKITTKFPYNVELGHIQPADITSEQQLKIQQLITKIAHILGFENCASHTELKINKNGIFIIETSPRLGGDFISSTLVPLSTGINMEEILIDISTGTLLPKNFYKPKFNKNSGIIFFELPEGIVIYVHNLNEIDNIEEIYSWNFDLNMGDKVNKITSSLDRYGYAIFHCSQKKIIDSTINKVNDIVHKNIKIKLL